MTNLKIDGKSGDEIPTNYRDGDGFGYDNVCGSLNGNGEGYDTGGLFIRDGDGIGYDSAASYGNPSIG